MAALVLVIEDEPAIRDSLVYVLTSEGFMVETAGTLADAGPLLGNMPALVVLDVGLPDGSGFDFFRELRRTTLVPVLFLTARASEIDRVVGLELGADDYVTKPFSPREVAARVKAILRRTHPNPTSVSPHPASQSVSTPLVIDDLRKVALLDGQIVTLSRQELRLLTVLASAPGQIFSRARLLDLAWDDPTAAFDRTIDSHIKALRVALRVIRPHCDPIITVRGEGYAIVEVWT